ncbi:GPI ethanolamine phosphate transferase 3, putative [Plasmodium ovale]|uniref:GPI ethanolamine phosphate transferase 3, putative n=1 Tax=Plasmodium ovale TaxID=36330 RepID=A0A1C3L561_PLAOA|nr:GPI ethanolamine phosphate transferase 3, putative [Plasmodium ovale]
MNKSENLETFSKKVFGEEYVEFLKKNKNVHSIVNPPYDRIVILLIDALRFDFALYDPQYREDAEVIIEESEDNKSQENEGKRVGSVKHFLNNMKHMHSVLQGEKANASLFLFEADAPTITTSRLKSMLIGTVPNYMDVNENFTPNDNIQDNFVEQLYYNEKVVTAIGDDTITKLTKSIKKKLVYESFNIYDLHRLDEKLMEHFYEEYPLNDWDVLYIHVLGVDHVGHMEKPNSKSMKNVLIKFDIFIYDIINKIKLEKNKNSLFVVLGDHGQMDSGQHSGASSEETDSALFVYSPIPFSTLDENIKSTNFVLYDKNRISLLSPSLRNLHLHNIDEGGYKRDHSALNRLNKDRTYFYDVRYTKQINLVSTLSFLIGSTLPFCNIGNVIPELIPDARKAEGSNSREGTPGEHTFGEGNPGESNPWEDNPGEDNPGEGNPGEGNPREGNPGEGTPGDLLNLHYVAEISYANLWQINRYLHEYEKTYGVIKNDDYFFIKSSWKDVERDKSRFFVSHKKLGDSEKRIKSKKEEYIKYINKMRILMEVTQKYFYFIFTMKKPSFIVLCLIINIFFFLFFIILYYYSKLNYYHTPIQGTIFISVTTVTIILLLPLNVFNKKLYLMTLLFLFLILLIRYVFSKNGNKDLFLFFTYARMILLCSNLADGDTTQNGNVEGHQNKDSNAPYNDECSEKDTSQKGFRQRGNVVNTTLRCSSKDDVDPSMDNRKSFFHTLKRKLFKTMRIHRFFIFVIVWSTFALSYNYINDEGHYIHLVLIATVLLSMLHGGNFTRRQFFRGVPLLAILLLNAAASFTADYFEHNKEKLFLKRSWIRIALPVVLYLFSLFSINRGYSKLLQEKIRKEMIIGWTLQFSLVFMNLLNLNDHTDFWIPPLVYILTGALTTFCIFRRGSIIDGKKVEDPSFQKMYEICVSLFLVLASLLQLSLIIYSNTNFSVLLFLYTTLLFFHFYFLHMTHGGVVETRKKASNGPIDGINDTMGNVTMEWIRENRNIEMFNNSEERRDKCSVLNVKTIGKEKLARKLKSEENYILRRYSHLSEKNVKQIQVYNLIKNFSFFSVNEIDFYILSCVLLKYSFFLTGHKFVLNNLPLTSAFTGMKKYVWPLSQMYIFNHVFFPMIFSFFFVIYVFHLRRIKFMISFQEKDLYNFYLYPLLNFLFKALFLFCTKCIVSLWVAFHLDLHLMLCDHFLPNYFYLTSVVIVCSLLSLLILCLTRHVLLR